MCIKTKVLWLLWASTFWYNTILSLSFLLHRKCFWWISRKARQKLCFYSRKLFTPNDAAFRDALIQTFHDIRWEVMSVISFFLSQGPGGCHSFITRKFDSTQWWPTRVTWYFVRLNQLAQVQAESRQFRMSA